MDHQAFAQLLGNYGEFLGAVAVVATLAYLAVQVRQNTATIRNSESAHRSTIETELNLRFHEIRRDLYADPSLTNIFRTGLLDPRALDTGQWDRFFQFLVSMFYAFAEQYRLSDTLLVDRDRMYGELFRDLFRYPGARSFWISAEHFDAEWTEMVQSIFDQTEPASLEELIEKPSILLPNAPADQMKLQ